MTAATPSFFGHSGISYSSSREIICCQRLTKHVVTVRGEQPILRGIDVKICSGEYVAVVGKSGSGKSTLLNLLAGLDVPSGGEVLVDGIGLSTLSERQSAVWRGRQVGIVFQFFQLLPGLSVLENVMLPMDFGRAFGGAREARALELLERVGMAAHAHKVPTALSGGEQQRVAVARALANDPPIILADEPTGNLDSETSASIHQLLSALPAQGKTVLVVTHAAIEKVPYSRILTLADGVLVSDSHGASAADGVTR